MDKRDLERVFGRYGPLKEIWYVSSQYSSICINQMLENPFFLQQDGSYLTLFCLHRISLSRRRRGRPEASRRRGNMWQTSASDDCEATHQESGWNFSRAEFQVLSMRGQSKLPIIWPVLNCSQFHAFDLSIRAIIRGTVRRVGSVTVVQAQTGEEVETKKNFGLKASTLFFSFRSCNCMLQFLIIVNYSLLLFVASRTK